MTRLTFGMVTQWYDPEGGAAALPGVVSRALVRRGAEVQVLTGFPNYPTGQLQDGYRVRLYQRERIRGVTVHRAPLWPGHDTRPARRALNYFSFSAGATAVGVSRFPRTAVNLVHMTPATAALPALAMRCIRKTPYVLRIQDLWPETVMGSELISAQRHWMETGLHRMCDTLYRHASAIAVTSPGMAEAILRRGIAESKLHFIPNWADENIFRPHLRNSRLARTLGIDAPFVVMYAGNFGEYQCLDSLLLAADAVRNDARIHFALVGGGVEERRLRQLVNDLNLTNITFIPNQPLNRMTEIMALGDVHYIALRDISLFRATIPSKLQATLAAGRPTIAALAGDAARVLSASGSSTIVPCESVSHIVAAVKEYADAGRAHANAQGQQAREYYEANFSESASAKQLFDLLAAAATEDSDS